MKTMKELQKRLIIRSAQKLQNIPTFKPYESPCILINWTKGTTTKGTSINSAESQRRTYILRWVAEALMASLDTPKEYFLRQISRYKDWYKNSPKVLESLQIVERFI
jgi:hypothetical protein